MDLRSHNCRIRRTRTHTHTHTHTHTVLLDSVRLCFSMSLPQAIGANHCGARSSCTAT